MPLASKSSFSVTALFAGALFFVGCKANKNPIAAQRDSVASETHEASGQRFLPTSGNPEVALDTSKGSLCRTVQLVTGSRDKYANLPKCGEELSAAATPVSFAWDQAVQDAPLEATCYLAKALIPFYSVTTPATMRITSSCIISNRTAKEQPLVGSTSYDAILRGADGKTTRRTDVGLASGQTVIPAHGRIEGGLWLNRECATKQSPADCFATSLGNARELVLTSDSTGTKAHVTMDRDSDPLGIRK